VIDEDGFLESFVTTIRGDATALGLLETALKLDGSPEMITTGNLQLRSEFRNGHHQQTKAIVAQNVARKIAASILS
jgi:hypothetical protein